LAAEHEDIPRSTNEAARVAVQEATTAKLRATAALIVAIGAMAAAMASAFVAFLALRHWTWYDLLVRHPLHKRIKRSRSFPCNFWEPCFPMWRDNVLI
jgi:putative flippase GtrA